MAKFTDEDDALLEELGIEIETKPHARHTPREERVIAGFEDIQQFVEKHGRAPLHGEDRDIFERHYAVRLDRLRILAEYHALLKPLDHQGLLSGGALAPGAPDDMDDEALLAQLGVDQPGGEAITELRHVRSTAEKRAAEEIANRDRCEDFDRFKHLFDQVQRDLDQGLRKTRPFVKDAGLLKADIVQGQFFILSGQIVYVAEVGEILRAPNGEEDARLRAIYSNGTESNLLRRSLQRALYKDEKGRRITEPNAGPLFGSEADDEDVGSGTIYVLRSRSMDPQIAPHRELIHKIGVTGGRVEARLFQATTDATYLLAEVEIVATYQLFNINRVKLERLLHRIFAPARLDITIKDRFGNSVRPKEWYLVPLHVINEAVERVRDQSIMEYDYEPASARLHRRGA